MHCTWMGTAELHGARAETCSSMDKVGLKNAARAVAFCGLSRKKETLQRGHHGCSMSQSSAFYLQIALHAALSRPELNR